LSGCTSLADSVSAKGSGKSRLFNNNYTEVWSATVDAVSISGLQLVSASPRTSMILAKRNQSLVDYGENIAIFVEATSNSTTRVEIVSKKVMTTNLFASDSTDAIFSNIAYALGMSK